VVTVVAHAALIHHFWSSVLPLRLRDTGGHTVAAVLTVDAPGQPTGSTGRHALARAAPHGNGPGATAPSAASGLDLGIAALAAGMLPSGEVIPPVPDDRASAEGSAAASAPVTEAPERQEAFRPVRRIDANLAYHRIREAADRLHHAEEASRHLAWLHARVIDLLKAVNPGMPVACTARVAERELLVSCTEPVTTAALRAAPEALQAFLGQLVALTAPSDGLEIILTPGQPATLALAAAPDRPDAGASVIR
jgi:hypothetical protein